MKGLGTRDRRALLWGVGVLFAAVVGLRCGPAALRWVRGLRDRALAQEATLVRVEELIVRGPAVRDSLQRVVQSIVALAPDLVDGETSSDAQASLGAWLLLSANRHALKLVRVDALPDSAAGVFGRVAVHAEFEGDVVGVTRLIGGLESGEPLLTVSNVAIDAPDPTPHPRSSEVLHLSFDVQGYYLARRGT